MTPEEYLDALLTLPNIDDDLLPKISHDGKWVAWTWFQVGPACDVFAVPTDGSRTPIRLTDTPDSTYLVSWTPDSQAVIVAQDKDGNERDQLFRIDIDKPLVMVPLTEAEPNYYVRGGQLHPNGKWLVYAANLDVDSGEEIEETWLYRHDLESGERIPLAKPLKPVWMSPKLNHQGSHILYARKDLHPSGYQTWLVDINGLEDREFLNFGADVKTYASWHPDGHQILVIVENPTHRRVGITDKDGGEIRWLVDDPKVDVETAMIPPTSNQVVVIKNETGRMGADLIDLGDHRIEKIPLTQGNLLPIAPMIATSGGVTTQPPLRLQSGNNLSGSINFHAVVEGSSHSSAQGVISKQLRGEKDADWIGLYFSAQQPGDIVRYRFEDLNPKSFQSLSRTWDRTNLKISDLHPAEDFQWHSVDGKEIHGWLYQVEGEVQGTIIYIHGGPTYHSRDMLNPQIQFFVHLGFHVLDINYRGSTGYGLPFRESILEDGWGGREMEDIRTGIEALIQNGIAKPRKIGITGTSYGGYSSWWAITHFPRELIAAAAPICGMTDLVVDYETTRPDIKPYSEEMMGGSPSQVPERYFERSPIHFIQQIRGKLLIVQGAQDPNVTPKNVEDVVQRLDEAGIPYEVLAFEDEGHGISKTANQRTLYLRLGRFFKEALSGVEY